jgi:single-strand DNA-binding protein
LRHHAGLDLSELQMSSINRVLLTGNLTSDPSTHRTLSNGTSLYRMRLASNACRRTDSGWDDKPNYFDLVAGGGHADACARFLKRGSPVAVGGRLEWRQWEPEGQQRQAVEIVVTPGPNAAPHSGSESAPPARPVTTA